MKKVKWHQAFGGSGSFPLMDFWSVSSHRNLFEKVRRLSACAHQTQHTHTSKTNERDAENWVVGERSFHFLPSLQLPVSVLLGGGNIPHQQCFMYPNDSILLSEPVEPVTPNMHTRTL